MPRQIVMDHTGDTRHEFNAADQASIDAAERRFKDLTGAGFTAAVRTGPGESRVVKAFDGHADETLFFPRLTGG
jgi:hypothetical protein